MQRNTRLSNHRTIMAAVAALAFALGGLSACGSQTTATSDETMKEEPSDGVPSSYKGTLPTPDASKRYDNPQPRDNIKDGGTLRVPTGEIGQNWNFMCADGNNASIGRFWYYYQPHLWDYAVDGTATPNPDYLDDVKVVSTDPEVVEYDINEKATWNDGTPIDWTAFQATVQAVNGKDKNYNPATTAGYDQIESVKQGDTAKQVLVTFSKPFYPYQALFPNLVNPKAADADTFSSGWVNDPHNDWAAGPYVVDSFDNNKVVFKTNPKWWGNKPKLDTVEFIVMKDNATINAFRNGEVDLIGANASMGGVASKDKLKAVRAMDDVQLRIGYTLTTDFLIYNTKSDVLKDKAVRKAITQGFDDDTWTKIHYQGIDWNTVQPGSLILYPFQKGYQDNRPKESNFSIDNAKKTLEDDGYKMGDDGYYKKGGKTLSISYTYFGDDAIKTASANAYQAMLKKIGVKVELKNEDSSQSSNILSNGQYDVLPLAWGASDPFGYATSLYQIYGSDSESNYSFIGDAETDALLNMPGTIEDMDEAIKAANKAEQAAMALYGQFPISVEPDYTAVRKGLANFGPSGFASIEQHVEDIGWQKD